MNFEDKIDAEIYAIGAVLIDSPFFQRSKQQTHHRKSTLYDHTMDMTRHAVKLCDIYEKKHADEPHHLDRKNVIIAALCHDLGMIDRKEKYANDFQAWRQHPEESARLAKLFFPDIDDVALNAIRHHMFPITLSPPRNLTERIILQADKTISIYDIHLLKKPFVQ